MVRSAAMHDMELPDSLLAIARAGAGVNNIPVDKCSEAGIVVFNTPGANANAVKELVIAGAAASPPARWCRGIEWAKTLKGQESRGAKLVEKGKSQPLPARKSRVRSWASSAWAPSARLVANAATVPGDGCVRLRSLSVGGCGLGPFPVRCITPPAWSRSMPTCDYITVHVPLDDPTPKRTFNADSLCHDEGRRADPQFLPRTSLVNSADMQEALASGKVAAYVVDFPTEESAWARTG